MKINALFLMAVVAFFLTACESEKSMNFYLENKDALTQKLLSCGTEDHSANCTSARDAQKILKQVIDQQFEVVTQCISRLEAQMSFMDKIVNVEAACPNNGIGSPDFNIDEKSGEVHANFAGDAYGIGATFKRRRVVLNGLIETYQWECSTEPAYEFFVPDVCITKVIYQYK